MDPAGAGLLPEFRLRRGVTARRDLWNSVQTKKQGETEDDRFAQFISLQTGDVRRLQAFRALGYFKFNRLTFVQRFISLRLDGGEMDKNVLAGLALDESEALAGIEPLHCSLFFHGIDPFTRLSCLMLLERLQPTAKKGSEFVLAALYIRT